MEQLKSPMWHIYDQNYDPLCWNGYVLEWEYKEDMLEDYNMLIAEMPAYTELHYLYDIHDDGGVYINMSDYRLDIKNIYDLILEAI